MDGTSRGTSNRSAQIFPVNISQAQPIDSNQSYSTSKPSSINTGSVPRDNGTFLSSPSFSDATTASQPSNAIAVKLGLWFREAKQSLSIAGPICTEANELVLTSRKQIEVATVMWTRVMFIHRAVNSQFELLKRIQQSFKSLEKSCINDFQKSLDELNNLEEKMDSILGHLENTALDNAFYKQGQSNEASYTSNSGNRGNSGGLKDRSLRSFVHDDGVDNLRKAVAIAVDQAQACVKELSQVITSLDIDINEFHKNMFSVQNIKRRGLETAHENTTAVASDAHEMATLLESLTRHYDLCLQAIEMNDKPGQFEDDLREIIPVLENDSLQLEGVVEELYDRRKSIEISEQTVKTFFNQMNDINIKVQTFFSDLLVFGVSKLTGYSDKLEDATRIHQSAMQDIAKLKQELKSLVDYYGLFNKSYQSLILEVLRRSNSQKVMKSMIEDMTDKIRNAHNKEIHLRQEFVKQYGDYLPNNLWDGLIEYPIEPQIIYEGNQIPELSQSTIAEATRQIDL